jgi:signal transduction histidine kinase/CheY-like chemotaxis protein
MRLSTRLILLIVGCLLPMVIAQIFSQSTLYEERHRQIDAIARQDAALADTDLDGLLDGVRQLAAIVAEYPDATSDTTGCTQRLTSLDRALSRYRFLALLPQNGGTPICTSNDAAKYASVLERDAPKPDAGSREVKIGHLVADPEPGEGYLPVSVNLPQDGPMRGTILVAAIDLRWLGQRLETISAQRSGIVGHPHLILADRNGTVLTTTLASKDWIGHPLPGWLLALASKTSPGSEVVTDEAGHAMLAAFVPNDQPSHGLTTINLLPLPQMTADIDAATSRDLIAICGAIFAALALAWVGGRRFIYRPTEALMQAARKWREGDLAARANLPEAGLEFASLAQSFNAMAAGLAARETERRMQASFLEAQVAERTRELSETNNRLQVEIAGREKTEAALHQAQKLQAVGQLAGGIAHDFNNLLATVLGNLELMERRVAQAADSWTTAEKDRLQRLIERAVGAVQRGSQLTSRLLAFSRRQRLAARPTDINLLLQELITLATSTLGRRVQVVPELHTALWPALVDPSQVEAAILNLCLNARDAMPEGGKLTIRTANTTIASSLHMDNLDVTPGDYVQVAISDTGMGMSPEVRARAFDPFFTTKGPGAGSGLGLSQVYGMARQSGGAVTIDSTLGEGTVVTLCLPRALVEGSAEPDTQNEHPRGPITTPTSPSNDLVLVVDDDNAVRQVTVEMARDLGCEVAQAAGGEQALALMDSLNPPPRMILLDYAMPGMNGLQLARALRERGVTAPIALVTGYAELSEADIQGGELAGLLRKPFTIRELQMLLRQLRNSPHMPADCLEVGAEPT